MTTDEERIALLIDYENLAIGAREDRERLSRELDEERERREAERARAQELEADLERERNRGFFSRMLGRR